MRTFALLFAMIIAFPRAADAHLVSGVPNCGDEYVLIAEEHDQVVPECDQFGCPEVESCDSCKEACDGDNLCEAFECNVIEGKHSCSFNGHLEYTETCGPLCQSQTVCVKNSTEFDGSHFVDPESQHRRKLWPLSGGPVAPHCYSGYKDKTNANAYWWACGVNCPGGKYWTDSLCRCACGIDSVHTGGCASLSSGNTHNCGILRSGAVKCWGYDHYGQVSRTPSGDDFIGVSSGAQYNCGLYTSGDPRNFNGASIACWGSDDHGQISQAPILRDYVSVASGHFHSCALRSNGTIDCWGRDTEGQVSHTPSGAYQSVSSGSDYSCALRLSGSIICWGSDYYGAISQTPIESDFVAVSAAFDHNCALRSSGSLVCWGRDSHGQVSLTPSDSDFVAVSGEGWHNCALRSSGYITCWGNDNFGQVSHAPNANDFVMVSSGYQHSCGLHASGSITCWGWDNAGQVSQTPKYSAFANCGANTVTPRGDLATTDSPNYTTGQTFACPRPNLWCSHPGAIYSMTDCDGDGILDHYCTDDDEQGFISSASGCSDTWPNGVCNSHVDGVNGEQYCESYDMMNNEGACKSSSCCHWNTWEEGEASNYGKGRCLSSIGEEICTDITTGESYCESDSMISNENGCKASSCCHWNTWEEGYASFNGKDGLQLKDKEDKSSSSFNTPLIIALIGSGVSLAAVAALAFCIWHQKNKSQKQDVHQIGGGTMVV